MSQIEVIMTGTALVGNPSDIINQALNKAISNSLEQVQNSIAAFTPLGVTSRLKSSFYKRILFLPSLVEGYLHTKSSYFNATEYGRPKGARMPPKGALLDWLLLKGRDIYSLAQAKRVEFLVRRKIKNNPKGGVFMAKKGAEASLVIVQAIMDSTGRDIEVKLNGRI
jgi:hypothetical protein